MSGEKLNISEVMNYAERFDMKSILIRPFLIRLYCRELRESQFWTSSNRNLDFGDNIPRYVSRSTVEGNGGNICLLQVLYSCEYGETRHHRPVQEESVSSLPCSATYSLKLIGSIAASSPLFLVMICESFLSSLSSANLPFVLL